jgi:hypothetical protein
MWMHTGSIDGMCAIIGLLPDKRTGVYILENLDHAELRHALMYSALDLYTGGSTRDWSADVHKLFNDLRRPAGAVAAARSSVRPALPLDRYAGTYVDSAYGTVQVTNTSGVLKATIGKDAAADLEAWEYETFRTHPATGNPSALSFVSDGAGHVTAVRMSGISFAKVRTAR